MLFRPVKLLIDDDTLEMIQHLRGQGVSIYKIYQALGIAPYRIWEVLGFPEKAARYRMYHRESQRRKRRQEARLCVAARGRPAREHGIRHDTAAPA